MVWEAVLSSREDFLKLQAAPGVEGSLLRGCCLARLKNETYLLTGLEFIMQKE